MGRRAGASPIAHISKPAALVSDAFLEVPLASRHVTRTGQVAAANTGPAAPRLPAALTEREAEVPDVRASGQGKGPTARALGPNPIILNRHVAKILEGLGPSGVQRP